MRAKTINEGGYLKDQEYSMETLQDDFNKAVKKMDLTRKERKNLWGIIYTEWMKNRIMNKDDVLVMIRRVAGVDENIGGAGGAGYAVWGGGWGRSFGNPSMGGRFAGRGFGFGGSQNLGGGPNLMYTYSVKPLTQDLQQPPTPQDDEQVIHTGSKIKGKILNTDQDIVGQIVHIEEDHDNNIKWYLVLDPDDGKQKKVDPTSAYLVQEEPFTDPWLEPGDFDVDPEEDGKNESFYPSL